MPNAGDQLGPSFFIIGAAKAATTTLWSLLSEHAEVFMPEVKEPNYLLGGRWARHGLGWYQSLFDAGAGARHRGDASPGYSMFPMFPGVPERAAALFPEAKMIYMIRHPVRRMVSHWTQATTAGYEHRPLEEALVWASAYYFTSCYGLQLSRWAQAYPKDALLVLRSEDLAQDPAGTLGRALAHLGLPPDWRPTDVSRRTNATEGKFRAPPQVRMTSGALRGAGLERAAVRLTKRTQVKERIRLVRPYHCSELKLHEDLERRLLDCFQADFRVLREFVGDEMDLYGFA